MSPTEGVVPLSDAGREDSARIGGKAAMLGVIAKQDLRTLPGFAISRECYDRALREVDAETLRDRFWQVGESIEPGNRQALRELSEEISGRLGDADISTLVEGVLAGFADAHIDAPELIVRSSATVEDSARLSYAGQFTSLRCAPSEEELAKAIVGVWSSCTAPHVAAYRAAFKDRSQGEGVDTVPSMGVVIQPHRTFSLAGLLFTQHVTVPVRGWMLIEFLDADPARLVAGEEVPHRCRVNPESRRVVWERRVPGRPVLSLDEMNSLIDGATKLKKAMEADVDIEWGLLDGTPCYLQCRPATTTPDWDV